jgi:HlyD family secretion protein
LNEFETEVVERGTLYSHVETNGYVTSNQTALLFWKITGEVDNIYARPGYQVSKGDLLASLDEDAAPAQIVAARSEKLTAELALEVIQNSTLQQSQAKKNLENAQVALEDALHPESLQAQAQENIASAQEALDIAQRNYEIATAITPQSAIDQAYANMILAENKIIETEELLIKLDNQYNRVKANEEFLGEDLYEDARSQIRDAKKQVEFALVQYKRDYENAVARYNELLLPPDPVDVAVAESDLAFAIAQLEEAEREWERIKYGASPGDLAVYEAQLNDAQRRWERIKDGPHPDDIIMLESRIAASEATLQQMDIVAPFDGTVTSVKSQVNDIVKPGTLAFQIDDLSHLFVNLTVTEIDIHRIKLGQDVVIRFDAVPGEEYHGKIVEIGLVGSKILGATNFQVKAELTDADDDVRLGMTTSALILISEVEDVLLVPNMAITGINGDLVAYRLLTNSAGSLIPLFSWEPGSDGGFPLTLLQPLQIQPEPLTITLGLKSSTYSEVLTGDVQVGDSIILNPPSE